MSRSSYRLRRRVKISPKLGFVSSLGPYERHETRAMDTLGTGSMVKAPAPPKASWPNRGDGGYAIEDFREFELAHDCLVNLEDELV